MKCFSTNIANCVVIQRGLAEDSVYVICNMSHKILSISPLNELNTLELNSDKRLLDNITGSYLNTDTFKLNPYQVVWLTLDDQPYEE